MCFSVLARHELLFLRSPGGFVSDSRRIGSVDAKRCRWQGTELCSLYNIAAQCTEILHSEGLNACAGRHP